MLKLLSVLSYFLRELIFDSKDEYDLSSSKFNMRKVAVFLVLALSITLNLFLGNRTVALASANVDLRKQIELKQKASEKNPKPVPSDSGNPAISTPAKVTDTKK